jgi:hypothetical protein
LQRLWTEIDGVLVGRRSLIEKMKPYLDHPTKRFFLRGERDVGKTALLEAAHDLSPGAKAFVNGAMSHRELCRIIVESWDVEVEHPGSKPTIGEMERAILKTFDNALFVDDVHKLGSGGKIDLLRAIADRNRIYGTILNHTPRESIRPLLAKMGDEIIVQRLSRRDTLKLAKKVCLYLGSKLLAGDVATAAAGLPGKVVLFASTNLIQRDEIRTKDQEIDISLFFLIGLVCLMIFRYVGRAVDQHDLTLIGASAMILTIIVRGLFFRGKNK